MGKIYFVLSGLTSLLTMATMKKMTKPASTTIAVFVTCIEILREEILLENCITLEKAINKDESEIFITFKMD